MGRGKSAGVPGWVLRGRAGWRWTGAERPPFAEAPRAGQESVWDYPRPPRIDPDPREVMVAIGDDVLARTTGAVRVLETASPPTYYLPPDDVDFAHLVPGQGESHCEWKGRAGYWSYAHAGREIPNLAWAYDEPYPEFESIRGWLAFYPALADCRVAGERVRPQPGRFYGGWVTDALAGPFKGEPGSQGW